MNINYIVDCCYKREHKNTIDHLTGIENFNKPKTYRFIEGFGQCIIVDSIVRPLKINPHIIRKAVDYSGFTKRS